MHAARLSCIKYMLGNEINEIDQDPSPVPRQLWMLYSGPGDLGHGHCHMSHVTCCRGSQAYSGYSIIYALTASGAASTRFMVYTRISQGMWKVTRYWTPSSRVDYLSLGRICILPSLPPAFLTHLPQSLLCRILISKKKNTSCTS